MNGKVGEQEALIYVMVMLSAVDRAMTNDELGRIGMITRTLPVFENFDEERLLPIAQDCAGLLNRDDGLTAALDLIAGSLSPSLYETAYTLGVDIAVADRDITAEEARLLQLLRRRLGLERLVTAAIERGSRARYARPARNGR